jgi:hypothetical protein
MTDLLDAIPQKHSALIADAWQRDNRQIAARFGQAVRRARSELPGGSFASIVRRAWALDPELRGLFGAAVSAGLRKMWASDVLRAEQSARIRKAYTRKLRKLRSERLRANWADADFRAKMMRARAEPAPKSKPLLSDDYDRRRRREMA